MIDLHHSGKEIMDTIDFTGLLVSRISAVEWVTTIGGSLVTVPLPNNGTVTRPSD